MKRELKVSFALPSERDEKKYSSNRTASQQYNLSISLPQHDAELAVQQLVTPRSPLYPENIIPAEDRSKKMLSNDTTPSRESVVEWNNEPVETVEKQNNKAARKAEVELDAAHGAILIYPKKIDNLRRFRILFVGVLLIISSSTQGVHSLFGTLYLQVLFKFNVRKMAIVYLCGQAFGMFVFPFGMLYDWFGPRIVVAVGSVIAAVGHLLFALTFGGHIEATVSNCAIFYAIMCWGCYALNVTVLPAVLTHMPRDRGQPTGLLETFSGLGSSFFSCLFRGFFSNNYENLMWFMFAVTVVVGVVGTWYLEDAPYMVNRWQQLRITPREQLRKYLMRNRYMSQLVPQRRYMIMSVVLVLLNFYLTIQAVVVSYLASQMTDGKRRGIAIGAIVIVLFLLVLLIPVNAIDGPTEQDKQVIEAAKKKEEELRTMQEERYRQRHLKARAARQQAKTQAKAGGDEDDRSHEPIEPDEDAKGGLEARRTHANFGSTDPQELEQDPLTLSTGATSSTDRDDDDNDSAASANDMQYVASPVEVLVPSAKSNTAASPNPRARRGGVLSNSVGLPFYEPTDPERQLLNVYLDDDEDEKPRRSKSKDGAPPRKNARDMHTRSQSLPQRPTRHSKSASGNAEETHPPIQSDTDGEDAHENTPPHRNMSFKVRVDDEGSASLRESLGQSLSPLADSCQVQFRRAPPSTYDNPRVETITLCGEVYVAPVYQTTFWESLTYLDMWMIAYTTLCVWGVGLTMVGNWDIYIMLLARYGAMEQKHYILFAAIAGVTTAGGRVFIGLYERLLKIIRERTGVAVAATALYPITSIGLLIGTIFWIALPGDKVLILAYIFGPAFYGISSSLTPYVLGTIFDRDLGMHYGFCFFAGAVGFVLCFWCSWYLTYRDQTTLTPRGYMCVGHRRCMNRAVGIYVALVFSSVISSYIVHRRYSKLVSGKLTHRRVIVPRIIRIFETCGFAGSSGKNVKTAHPEEDADAVGHAAHEEVEKSTQS